MQEILEHLEAEQRVARERLAEHQFHEHQLDYRCVKTNKPKMLWLKALWAIRRSLLELTIQQVEELDDQIAERNDQTMTRSRSPITRNVFGDRAPKNIGQFPDLIPF